MAAKRNILVVGSSHTWAIHRAIEKRAAPCNVETIYIRNEKVARPGKPGVSSDWARKRIAGLEKGDAVFFTVGGGHHNIYGLFANGPPFEIYGRTSPQTKDVQLIGESLLYHLFWKTLAANGTMENMHRNAPCRTFHLAVRPPGKDNQSIEQRLARHSKGRTLLPPHVRLQMYQIEMMALRDYCREIGTTFVEPPPDAIDANGFLMPDYWSEDTLHANEKYGGLVLQQIEQLCG